MFFTRVILTTATLAVSSFAWANDVGQPTPVPVAPSPSSPAPSASPSELAFLAYRGSFVDAGIRSYGAFCSQWTFGQVDAEDVAAAGIGQRRVAAHAVDRDYLNALDHQLDIICFV